MRDQRRDSEVDPTKRQGHGGGELPLQSRIGTYRTLVERRLMLPDPAPSLHSGDSSQDQDPCRDDTPRFGMVWLPLQHGVPVKYQLPIRSSNSGTRLGHRIKTPNSRAPKDVACEALPSTHYVQACRQRDSMTDRTTLSPSIRRSPTAARNASSFLKPDPALCRTRRRCGRRPRAWIHP